MTTLDLAQAVGVPEAIELGGEEHPVRALKLREWAELQAWLKRAYPSPLLRATDAIREAKAAGTPLDPATADQLLDHAQRAALAWPPRLNSQAWYEAIDGTEGGLAQMLRAILRAADPAFTPEKAEALAPRLSLEEWLDLTSMAFQGHRSPPKKKGPPQPDAGPSPTPAPTTGG